MQINMKSKYKNFCAIFTNFLKQNYIFYKNTMRNLLCVRFNQHF